MPPVRLSAAPVNSGSDVVAVGLPVVMFDEGLEEVKDDSTGGIKVEVKAEAEVDVKVKVEVEVEVDV